MASSKSTNEIEKSNNKERKHVAFCDKVTIREIENCLNKPLPSNDNSSSSSISNLLPSISNLLPSISNLLSLSNNNNNNNNNNNLSSLNNNNNLLSSISNLLPSNDNLSSSISNNNNLLSSISNNNNNLLSSISNDSPDNTLLSPNNNLLPSNNNLLPSNNIPKHNFPPFYDSIFRHFETYIQFLNQSIINEISLGSDDSDDSNDPNDLNDSDDSNDSDYERTNSSNIQTINPLNVKFIECVFDCQTMDYNEILTYFYDCKISVKNQNLNLATLKTFMFLILGYQADIVDIRIKELKIRYKNEENIIEFHHTKFDNIFSISIPVDVKLSLRINYLFHQIHNNESIEGNWRIITCFFKYKDVDGNLKDEFVHNRNIHSLVSDKEANKYLKYGDKHIVSTMNYFYKSILDLYFPFLDIIFLKVDVGCVGMKFEEIDGRVELSRYVKNTKYHLKKQNNSYY